MYVEQEFHSALIAPGDKYWMFYNTSIIIRTYISTDSCGNKQAAIKSLSLCYTEVIIINISELQCHVSDILTLKITNFSKMLRDKTVKTD